MPGHIGVALTTVSYRINHVFYCIHCGQIQSAPADRTLLVCMVRGGNTWQWDAICNGNVSDSWIKQMRILILMNNRQS